EASDAAKVEKKNSAAADKAAEDADNKPSPSTVDPVLAHLAASPEAATVACLAIGLPGTAAGPAPGSGATGLDDAAVLVDPTAIATGAVLAAATAATAAAAPPGAARANGMPTAASADQHRVADGAESSRAELSVDVPPGLLKQAGLAMELPSSSNMAAQRAQLSEPAERPGLTAHLATGHADHRGDLLNNLAASMDKDSRRVGSVSEVAASASAAQPLAPFAVGPGASQRLPDVAPSVVLTTPVQAPEFREALATQVSLLAKDGVQQASLQLNPADMGPISVQISLDGTQARVDFAVDSAATRHIIEAGLPELASALREAGLTLSGGGVSQQQSQSAQQEAGAQHPGRSTPSGREEADPADAPGRRTVSVATGGLDLYA
ncbi:MAG: flagellar hook-length control protein FliK, partial [Pseudomonadota bacterium]